MTIKGILLAGGLGTRLHPLTIALSKQLLPVYDKPMIYYPLSVLMLCDIRDIIVISTPRDLPAFRSLLGDGSAWGINIQYGIQTEPNGIAQAFIIAEEFLRGHKVALVLGDNIFYGASLSSLVRDCLATDYEALIFTYRVRNPTAYGVVEFDAEGQVTSIEEKPKEPKSDWAITGLYFYGSGVTEVAKSLKRSPRGELEISDLNRTYLDQGRLRVQPLGRGFAWLDTGTHDALLEASEFVRAIEHRQGLKIACLEEIAFVNGWIKEEQVAARAKLIRGAYGRYLQQLIE